jgi:hypothetical protein
VQALDLPGIYSSGPVIHTLVGNIDDDPTLEILTTALAQGPLYAWNHDGSPVPGWPGAFHGAAYPALGVFAADFASSEVFAGHYASSGLVIGWSGNGVSLPGWPRESENYVFQPPAIADLDNDGLDEIVVGEAAGDLHAYRSDGTELPGWPVQFDAGGQFITAPAVADVDGDGYLDLVSSSSGFLLAFDRFAAPPRGYPVFLEGMSLTASPIVGDVDGDRRPDLIAPLYGLDRRIAVLSAAGQVVRTMVASSEILFTTAVALADLDGDGMPEILAQSNEALDIWKGDGTALPGWPRTWPGYWQRQQAPVVGDVDGDGSPDIVVILSVAESQGINAELRVYDRHGNLHPRFPKPLRLGAAAVPAIADIDLDGRNEIIVTSDYWDGVAGYHDKVWVYDLGGPPHGPVLWGQYRGGARHQGRYAPQLRRVDLLWQNALSGDLMAWLMHHAVRVSPAPLDPRSVPDRGWEVATAADLTGDGSLDAVWRHAGSGELVLWTMEGTVRLSGVPLNPARVPDLNWGIKASGDFNQDGKDDLIWRHEVSGQLVVWYMDGRTLTSGTFLSPSALPDAQWDIAAAADFNVDGHPDLLWRHHNTGDLVVWYMNGASLVGGSYLEPPRLADLGWKIVAAGDYDRDGDPDIAWQHGSGQVVLWYMDGVRLAGGEVTEPSTMADRGWRIVGPK